MIILDMFMNIWIDIGELITIKCKGKPQEVVLKRDNEM